MRRLLNICETLLKHCWNIVQALLKLCKNSVKTVLKHCYNIVKHCQKIETFLNKENIKAKLSKRQLTHLTKNIWKQICRGAGWEYMKKSCQWIYKQRIYKQLIYKQRIYEQKAVRGRGWVRRSKIKNPPPSFVSNAGTISQFKKIFFFTSLITMF